MHRYLGSQNKVDENRRIGGEWLGAAAEDCPRGKESAGNAEE